MCLLSDSKSASSVLALAIVVKQVRQMESIEPSLLRLCG